MMKRWRVSTKESGIGVYSTFTTDLCNLKRKGFKKIYP